jgi:hypothetical protein
VLGPPELYSVDETYYMVGCALEGAIVVDFWLFKPPPDLETESCIRDDLFGNLPIASLLLFI